SRSKVAAALKSRRKIVSSEPGGHIIRVIAAGPTCSFGGSADEEPRPRLQSASSDSVPSAPNCTVYFDGSFGTTGWSLPCTTFVMCQVPPIKPPARSRVSVRPALPHSLGFGSTAVNVSPPELNVSTRGLGSALVPRRVSETTTRSPAAFQLPESVIGGVPFL